jgi:hypothetical protein
MLGRSADVQTVSGTVSVQLPGTNTFVPLSSLQSVPLGTIVDTTNGTVQLTSAADRRGHTQTGQFYGGAFQLAQRRVHSQQRRGASVELTVLRLTDATAAMECPAVGARATAARRRHRAQLWGRTHGGSFAAETHDVVAGRNDPTWLTEETCSGTLVKVTQGVVSVENLHTHRAVLVRAGHSSLVRATSAISASAPCTKPALEAALTRTKVVGRIAGNGFGCAGQFAYAAVLVHIGTPDEIEITALFRAAANEWHTVRRSVGECRLVPKKIRRPACESN